MVTQQQKQKAIDAICQANNGVVTPDLVVEAAKDPESVLHSLFDWDDRSAARKHRQDTARRIISSVEVWVEYEERTVTAISYVRDPRLGNKEQGYVPISQLARRREEAQQSLLVELDRVVASIERARSIASGLGLESYFEAIFNNALTAKAKIRVKQQRKAA